MIPTYRALPCAVTMDVLALFTPITLPCDWGPDELEGVGEGWAGTGAARGPQWEGEGAFFLGVACAPMRTRCTDIYCSLL